MLDYKVLGIALNGINENDYCDDDFMWNRWNNHCEILEPMGYDVNDDYVILHKVYVNNFGVCSLNEFYTDYVLSSQQYNVLAINNNDYRVMTSVSVGAIYEMLRDGYAVILQGQMVKFVNLDNGTIVRRDELSDEYYESLNSVGAIWKEFIRWI